MWMLNPTIIPFSPGEKYPNKFFVILLEKILSLLVEDKILYLKIGIPWITIVLNIREKIRNALSKSVFTDSSYIIVFKLIKVVLKSKPIPFWEAVIFGKN